MPSPLTPYERAVQIVIDRALLDQRNASLTMHFDKDGQLRSIERKEILFNDRFEPR